MDRRTLRRVAPAIVTLLVLLLIMNRYFTSTSYDSRSPSKQIDLQESPSIDLQIENVPDTRPTDCKAVKYDLTQQDVSIVILLKKGMTDSAVERTLKAIVNRTPMRLVTEILIVHTKDMPAKVLDAVKELKIDKVKLVETDSEESWMKLRINEGLKAIGSIVVFLDGNSECNVGWLEPLLDALKSDDNKIVMPHLDGVEESTFDYNPVTEITRTIFDWRLTPVVFEVGFEELMTRNTEMDHIKSAAFTGMTFVTTKKYLEHISKHMLHHELTAIEISFFTWMCGGKMEIIPCSRVGKGKLFEVENDFTPRHLQQVAEGWLDDYKKYYYAVATSEQLGIEDLRDPIDQIRGVRAIRTCKKFDYFLKNIASDVTVPPPDTRLYGFMKSVGGQTCFSASIDDHLLSTTCAISSINNQVYVMKSGLVQIGQKCASCKAAGYIRMEVCDATDAHQQWKVTDNAQLSIKGEDDRLLCMMHATDPSPEKRERQIVMAHECDGADGKLLPFQQWQFSFTVKEV